jgi:DNA-binding NarL/FixJ family response regulator
MKRTGAAAGLRIVVVEDEVLISMEIEDLLADMGAEVVGTALSAAQAIRLAESARPDCLTMDISLQGPRDGISAAIEIYERFGVRSVFVSAYGNPETVARAQPARPLAWLSKPIDRARLEAALSAVPRNPSDG